MSDYTNNYYHLIIFSVQQKLFNWPCRSNTFTGTVCTLPIIK